MKPRECATAHRLREARPVAPERIRVMFLQSIESVVAGRAVKDVRCEDGSLDPDELTNEPAWWDEGSDDE